MNGTTNRRAAIACPVVAAVLAAANGARAQWTVTNLDPRFGASSRALDVSDGTQVGVVSAG